VFRRKFKNCSKMRAWVRKHPRGLPEALTVWVVQASAVPQGGGVWKVTYSLGKGSYVAKTVYSWTNMTAGQRRALQQTLADLSVHEHGHLTIATRYLRSQTDTFNAGGMQEAKAKLSALVNERTNALNKREREYDKVTAHGAYQSSGPAQGFPGGNDVVWRCPR
jgi:hypothetical protein